MPFNRRSLLAAPLLLAATAARAETWPRRVTDLLGRQVTLPRPPRRILLGEGMYLLTLGLLHPDPVSLLVGTGGDLRRLDPVIDAAWRRAFPALDRLPEVTTTVGQALPLERTLSLTPDLVILGAWQEGSAETMQAVERLASAGIPTIFIDLFRQPLRNTAPSLRLLGQVLERETQAEAFIALHETHLARIRDRLPAPPAPGGRNGPPTLLTAFPGRWPCCWVAGQGGGGDVLALLQLANPTAQVLGEAQGGAIGLEVLMSLQPRIVVGTGMHRPSDELGLLLGSGVSPDRARQSLAAVAATREMAALEAVKSGRVHGLWNYFAGTAIGILAAEAMARWTWPALFPELDPAATLQEINQRFAAVPFEGTYWISLDPKQDGPS
ncbi:ABC transporter substrate-binding protein [Roseomonas sp. 18066]|uniref:ABC transporter substrate-binding protein n=1 Tax=Roseomonas sp. 18066 TaxID=2681412 RepID=UPI00135AA3B1|nr:ABC transporter substrate-binding protein [Roseomonas sp. 18066]